MPAQVGGLGSRVMRKGGRDRGDWREPISIRSGISTKIRNGNSAGITIRLTISRSTHRKFTTTGAGAAMGPSAWLVGAMLKCPLFSSP